MEIEFNTNRMQSQAPAEPAVKKAAATPAAVSDPLLTTTDLQRKLATVSLVRPEKVDQARQLVASEKYPPDDLLDRIAVLLAMQLK